MERHLLLFLITHYSSCIICVTESRKLQIFPHVHKYKKTHGIVSFIFQRDYHSELNIHQNSYLVNELKLSMF